MQKKFKILLSDFFKNNFMYKPFYSRPTSAEKYLVCKGFNKPKNLDKKDGRALQRNVDAIKCSPESDGTTTYVQKKEWVEVIENYQYPPYVDCEYVN